MDLGGIGKGYALDWMLDILSSWGQGQAIVAAGASTQRVMGPQPIKFALKGDLHEKTLWLKNLSLSSSGIGIQDAHIIDPRHNTSQTLRKRAWCITKRASYADAWSTAAMLMNEQELSDALEQNEQLTLVILEDFKGDFTVLGQPTENCRLEGTP
jgi:thiamine biosynthesis lipoprotein ApbE